MTFTSNEYEARNDGHILIICEYKLSAPFPDS